MNGQKAQDRRPVMKNLVAGELEMSPEMKRAARHAAIAVNAMMRMDMLPEDTCYNLQWFDERKEFEVIFFHFGHNDYSKGVKASDLIKHPRVWAAIRKDIEHD